MSYFQSIFSVDNNYVTNNMVARLIPNLVTTTENDVLCSVPLSSEIKAIVFDLNGDGAPGPDGFGDHFYQTFCDIVENVVVNYVQDFFFITGVLARNVNSNLIVLVPKVPGAKAMGDFRPIALANFQFKIITKIIADILASIAMHIVSTEQRGFIKEHNISDCVILASEAINCMDRWQFGGNIALNVDISKAFDTLDWKFFNCSSYAIWFFYNFLRMESDYSSVWQAIYFGEC